VRPHWGRETTRTPDGLLSFGTVVAGSEAELGHSLLKGGICSFHGYGYSSCDLLGCDTV
jgi:hypothetical protein